MDNFKACIARVNSTERYQAFKNSGFWVLERPNAEADTKEETLAALAQHFKLV